MSVEKNVLDSEDFYTTIDDGAEPISAPVLGSVGVEESKESIQESTQEPAQEGVYLNVDFNGSLIAEEDDTEYEEDTSYSPEERLSGMADKLLSACFGLNKSISRYAIDKLSALRSPSVFRDENYILFTVLYNFRGRIRYISIDEEFLKLYLNRNRKLLNDAKSFIDINAYGEIDGSAELGYISGVLKHYKRLYGMGDMSEIEFNTVYEKYMIEFKSLETNRALQQSGIILNEGMHIGRKYYFGSDDSIAYFTKRTAEINGLVNIEQGSGFITSREMALEKKDVNKSYKVGDFGRITTLNKVYGGIMTGMMYEFIAPPKAGKSKLTTRLAHNIVVEHGNNITVWAPEGGCNAWFAQFRAIHFDYLYNTGVGVKDKKYGVDQNAIVNDNYPSEEIKQLENSSKLDIGTNEGYGTIDFIDKPLKLSTFLQDIDTSVKSNNSVAVVIDYLQMMPAENGKQVNDTISEAYVTLLDYCKRNNIAVILPAQYNQDSFNKLIESKNTDGVDMRTSGGKSAEVIRTPDIIIALWATTQDLLNGTMKLLSMPTRYAKPFPEIIIDHDLGPCIFIERECA